MELPDHRAHALRPFGAALARRTAVLLLVLATIGTLVTHEAYVLRPEDPMWAHLAPMAWWLVPHIAGGALVFVIAPLQFSATLRRRFPAWHRWLGRIYVGAALLASALSVYIVVTFEIQANWWVMGAMGGLWFLTTMFAWFAALNRDFVQHRVWIGRSFGLAFTFVLTRVIPDMALPGMDYVKVTALYWAFIVISLLIPDIVMSWRSILPVGARGSRFS